MELNQSGQAALTDALFFLAVVAGLASLLFVFSAGYGLNVTEAMVREYQSDFASSAMKTILYSSTPRNPSIPLDDSNEVDYLLATVKEDFADDQDLDKDESLYVLRDNIVGIMEPFADNFDYLFYIYVVDTTELDPEKSAFPVFLLYSSAWTTTPVPNNRRQIDVVGTEDRIYFCNPSSLDPIDFLLSNVGNVQQETSRMELLLQDPSSRGHKTLVSQVNLAMWTSTKLPEGILEEQIDAGNGIFLAGLNCTQSCDVKKMGGQWSACGG
jgi:hypothetical protein